MQARQFPPSPPLVRVARKGGAAAAGGAHSGGGYVGAGQAALTLDPVVQTSLFQEVPAYLKSERAPAQRAVASQSVLRQRSRSETDQLNDSVTFSNHTANLRRIPPQFRCVRLVR